MREESQLGLLCVLRSNQLLPEYQARAAEGLSRLLAFLREEAEKERLDELEKLKPVGRQVQGLPS